MSSVRTIAVVYCISIILLDNCNIVSLSAHADSVCKDGDLRLRDGTSARDGRVELCHGNAWGTICDDEWDSRDAQVVCRQLGFADAGTYSHKSTCIALE